MSDLKIFVQDVSEHLDGWRCEETTNDWRSILVDSDQRRFLLMKEGNGKIKITGIYPKCNNGTYIYGQSDEPEIKISAKREPKSVAGDIEKRFLPKFLRHHEKILALKKRYDENDGKARALAEEFGEIVGDEPTTHDGSRFVLRVYGKFPAYIKIDAGDEPKVDFELNGIPLNMAKTICHLISENRR